MNRPYVIIHTHTSIDGNIDIMDLPEFREASRQYQELSLDPKKQQLDIQGYLNGKTSTESLIPLLRKQPFCLNRSKNWNMVHYGYDTRLNMLKINYQL